MTDKEYNGLRNSVKSALIKLTGSANEYEDATQYAALTWLERGGSKGQTVTQVVIDYLRQSSGRKGHDGYESRRNINGACSLEELRESGFDLGDRSAVEPNDPDDRMKAFKALSDLDKYLLLEPNNEMAKDFQVSESRFSQHQKKAIKRLEQNYFLLMLGVCIG